MNKFSSLSSSFFSLVGVVCVGGCGLGVGGGVGGGSGLIALQDYIAHFRPNSQSCTGRCIYSST